MSLLQQELSISLKMNSVLDFWKFDRKCLDNTKLKDIDNEINDFIFDIETEKPNYSKFNFLYKLAPVKIRDMAYCILYKRKNIYINQYLPNVEVLRKKALDLIRKKCREIKYISLWEKGKDFAIALTHDCDNYSSYRNIDYIREIEKRYGFKSAWYFPSHEYRIKKEKLRELKREGCEIGLHGFKHDVSFPFESELSMRKKLEKSLSMLKEFNLKGYRAPLLLRTNKMLTILSKYFIYDSSVHDTDFCSPYKIKSKIQKSGCLSLFPYFIKKDLIELPITMIQDARMIKLNFPKTRIFSIWKEKIDLIKKFKGMVMLLTHADSHYFGNDKYYDVYEKILGYLSKFDNTYKALPCQIAEWWKERDNSYIKNNKIIGSKRAVIEQL